MNVIKYIVLGLAMGSIFTSHSNAQQKKWSLHISPQIAIGNTYSNYPKIPVFSGDVSKVSLTNLIWEDIGHAFLMGLRGEVRYKKHIGLALGSEYNISQFRGNLQGGESLHLAFRRDWNHFSFPLVCSYYHHFGDRGYMLQMGAGIDLSIYTEVKSGTATGKENEIILVSHARERVLNQGLRSQIGLLLPLSTYSELGITIVGILGVNKPILTEVKFYQADEPFEDFFNPPEKDVLYRYTNELQPIQLFFNFHYSIQISGRK